MLVVRTRVGPSTVQGVGVIAVEDVPAGALVWKNDPAAVRFYGPDEVASVSPAFREFLVRHAFRRKGDDRLCLCLDDTRHMNHSDDPNVREDPATFDSFAVRPIRAGEEITCDYRDFDDDFDGTF